MESWIRLLSVWVLLSLVTGCVPAKVPDSGDDSPAETSNPMAVNAAKIELKDLGAAPELKNEVWLNTDQPLRLADLRGKVVLLNMWTFDCYNCKNVVPYVRTWHDTYAGQGLVVIGNHFPEFKHEADLGNLQAAVSRLDIRYPVAQDNDRQTWDAYHNRYWPTLYLIDKHGRLRYQHIGEGAYPETEAAIRALLAEAD
jgi:thiol-disulfide isomerase/thioredoxin